jgi:hypothetical protein
MMSKTFDFEANGSGSKDKVQTIAGGQAVRVPLDRFGCGFKDRNSWEDILVVLEQNPLCANADAEASAI